MYNILIDMLDFDDHFVTVLPLYLKKSHLKFFHLINILLYKET
jgi:hypothetical protein